MNSHPRGRLATAAVTAAPLLGFLALVTACGSSSSTNTAGSAGQKQALEYAQCMRANGVPDFPDPDPNGRFSGVGHEQQDNPDFVAAQEACRDLAPGGEHERLGDPAFVAQMREFSRCMRANGVPDFPDPDPDGRLRGAGHEQRSDPQYQAAADTCRSKLPGGGAHGG